jgi:hypothetical protein
MGELCARIKDNALVLSGPYLYLAVFGVTKKNCSFATLQNGPGDMPTLRYAGGPSKKTP